MRPKHILIQGEGLGRGDDTLGKILMANYLRLMGEAESKPESMIFWNGAVRLLCEGSPVLEHVKKLARAGVTILACTTCLEYFELDDKLAVGERTTMAKSIEAMAEGDLVTL